MHNIIHYMTSHTPLMHTQLPWPQSIVPGWQTAVQSEPSHAGAKPAFTHETGWQHCAGTQSLSDAQETFSWISWVLFPTHPPTATENKTAISRSRYIIIYTQNSLSCQGPSRFFHMLLRMISLNSLPRAFRIPFREQPRPWLLSAGALQTRSM